MIDTTKQTLSPRFLKNKLSFKDTSITRWEAEPASNKSRKARRTVSFSAIDTVHFVLPRSDYSNQEKRDAWYNKQDFLAIKKANKEIARKMTVGACTPEIETRGLEYKTAKGMEERQVNRDAALFAVLDEEFLQEEIYGCVLDAERVAKLCRQASAHCQLKAIRTAAMDALAVHGHLELPIIICEQKKTLEDKKRRSVFSVFTQRTSRRSKPSRD